MAADLDSYAWPATRLGEALAALAQQAGLDPREGSAPVPALPLD